MAKKANGGIKGKGKKSGGGGATTGGGGHSQHHGGGKLKKTSQFKALHKQRASSATTAVVEVKRKPENRKPESRKPKQPLRVPDEVRSFNERVAGERKRGEARKQQLAAVKSLSVAPPTFVIAAPTFSFGAPPPPPVKEVEGFQGFLSTMTAPKDAPQPRPDPETRRVKPVQPAYQDSNVFAVLEVDDEQDELQRQHMLQQQQQAIQKQQQAEQRAAAMAAAAQLPSPFLQPATFSFQSSAPAFQFPPPGAAAAAAVANTASALTDIDPDL